MCDEVKPCRQCGGTERYKNGSCKACRRASSRASLARNRGEPDAPPKKREGRGNGPCKKCGSMDRYANGNCRPCAIANANKRWVENRTEILLEEKRRRSQEHYKNHYRWTRRNRLYGVSQETFDAMLSDQSGCCAICLEPVDYTAHVDHDHATDEVRGVLCNSCNTGLGHFKDDTARLNRAVAYLEASRGPETT